MRRLFLLMGAFVVAAVAAGSVAAVMFLPEWLHERATQVERPQYTQALPSATPDQDPEPSASDLPLMDFTELLQRNSDVVGWISIDDTAIDDPVLQGTDNVFYLRHDLDKEYDIEGIPYVDYECDVENGRHLIVYGHNMGVNRTDRFSDLQNYIDPEYYTQHPVIQFNTLYDSTLYKVVAVYVLTARTSDADYFAFNTYVDFEDDAAQQQYLDEIAQRAFYTTGDYVRADERLLTLCTCTYQMGDARILVMARPLREEERATADSVTINPDPLLPARWPAGA